MASENSPRGHKKRLSHPDMATLLFNQDTNNNNNNDSNNDNSNNDSKDTDESETKEKEVEEIKDTDTDTTLQNTEIITDIHQTEAKEESTSPQISAEV